MANKHRGSLGFKGVNGRAIRIRVMQSMPGKFMNKDVSKRMNAFIVAQMNKAGRKGRSIAGEDTGHTPWLTGRLTKSIRWEKARVTPGGNLIQGRMTADTPYARRIEFTNWSSKPRYLQRALHEIVQPEFLRLVAKKADIEGVFAGGIGFR